MALKDKLRGIIPKRAKEWQEFLKEHGNKTLCEVKIEQAFRGMRDVMCMVWEGSLLDPHEGIRFRGYSIPEVRQLLPKAKGGSEPLAEGILYLLMTGEIPTDEDVEDLRKELFDRMHVPDYVFEVMKKMPKDTTHPMTLFSLGVLALENTSKFREAYNRGIGKAQFWEYGYEDGMDLLARVPIIAAFVYRYLYKDGSIIPPDPNLDWAANYAHMLGIDSEEFYELMRLYLVLHSDHEGGNVSAHTGHLVGSALSSPYLAISSALNGLAGPLHGLAAQEVLKWIFDLEEWLEGEEPTNEKIEEFAWKTLNEGRVIPGYGHAVLRKTDPRYVAFREFALKYFKEDPLFKIVSKSYEVIPDVLMKHGKAKNPWPNVDAHSGIMLYHYGIAEFDYYTVVFGVSRCLGIVTQLIWDLGLGAPIERPKSVTLEWLKDFVSEKLEKTE